MSKYDQYKAKMMNKGVDVDGYYGWQCWDGTADYERELTGRYTNTNYGGKGSGYAKDIWEQRHENGILSNFKEVTVMKPGDIAVFKEHPWTPSSHIAVFDSDIDGEYGWFFGQNQGSDITNPAGGSAFNLTKLPYSATYPTAFRLKKTQPKTSNTTKTKGIVKMKSKRVNGDLFSGLITNYDPNIMNADGNRTKIDRIVIHHNAGTNDAGARRTWYVSTGVGTSAHYQVTPNKIWGCVGEESVAYHAGDYAFNQRSIGIEHLNSTGAPTWLIDEKTYHNSAKLIADICQRYNIPIDRTHIVKHGEVSSTGCPGGINIDRLVALAKDYSKGYSFKKSRKPKAKVKVETTNHKTGEFAIRLYGVKSPDGIKKVEFPTWTEKDGQDDIKWNKAIKQKDGSWLFVDSVKRHKNQRGKYIVHAYITTPDGAKHGVGKAKTILKDKKSKIDHQ